MRRNVNKMHQVWLTLMTITMIILTAGCSDEPNVLNYEQVTSARVDLSGAVSIGISQGKPQSRAIEGEYLSAGMYKIDANGEIHAVAIYFTDQGQHTEKLRVAPKAIASISDGYMLAIDCDYYDSDNDLVQDLWIEKGDEEILVKQKVPYKNLLIRKRDGKIWCVDDIKNKLLYTIEPLKFKGVFREDNFGNLYFAYSGDNNIYKFNFSDITSSFEQLTYKAGINTKEDFHITDNGVFWQTYAYAKNPHYNQYSIPYYHDNVRISWPHKGAFDVLAPLDDDYPDTINSPLPIKYTLSLRYATKVECVKNVPVILCFPEYLIDDCTLEYAGNNKLSADILRKLKGEIAPALCYTVKIGDDYGDAELNLDSRIIETEKSKRTLNEWESNVANGGYLPMVRKVISVYKTYRSEYSGSVSTFAYDDIILLNDEGDLAKINIFNKTWNWLGATCPFHFDTAEEYANKLWKCEKQDGKQGMAWFDLSSYESGFVAFDRDIPDYMKLKTSIDPNGKRIYSGFNPATGQIETLEIDIQTGLSTTDSESPNYFLQSIINLN